MVLEFGVFRGRQGKRSHADEVVVRVRSNGGRDGEAQRGHLADINGSIDLEDLGLLDHISDENANFDGTNRSKSWGLVVILPVNREGSAADSSGRRGRVGHEDTREGLTGEDRQGNECRAHFALVFVVGVKRMKKRLLKSKI